MTFNMIIYSAAICATWSLCMSPVTAVRRLDTSVTTNQHHHQHLATLSELNTNATFRAPRRTVIGTNVDVPTANTPDDHLVTNLPLLDNDDFPTKHWAGLLPASDDGDKYLFYWLFAPDQEQIKKQKVAEKDIPLLIWLNGGPACSSMDGLWLENGPFRLTKDPKDPNKPWHIDIDPYSWHMAPAYVVYIDQPVGTGISFTTSGKYPTNDREVNVDFYYFLKKFLQLHKDKFLTQSDNSDNTKFTLSRPLYFSGESHAGHYIPSMMNYIQQQNKNSDITIQLAGAAIGNGWVDPIYQYSAQDAAYGYGMIGKAQQRALDVLEEKCREKLRNGIYRSETCFGLLDAVLDNSQGKSSPYIVSQYDQRKWEIKNKPRDFPPGHREVESYLGGHGPTIPGDFDFRNVLEAVHSLPSLKAGQVYYECTDPPYNALKHNDGLGVVPDVVDLLNSDIRLLFFNGIHDLICNHAGNENAVENFPWKFRDAFQKATRYGWKAPSKQQLGGYMKEHKNLQFLKVLDSGHMVPMDVPDISLDMIRMFMYHQSFQSYKQEIGTLSADESNPSCPICPTCENDGEKEAESPIASPVSCPKCDDCNKVCKDMKPNQESSSSSAGTSQLSGMVLGAVTFLTMAASWMICCLFLRRRRRSIDGHIPLSPRSGYDMELPKTNGFRDDVDESDGGGYADGENGHARAID
ncbi:serine carboxypeptidase [Nitzschia inconspicua]|uniref:Serine carboxypeptidase n=1 Tax=Nitzschia inconspicua TaxID=303405 RepID=A0A9K3PUB7_9STRA|nr:serine carboxypeptidase [Nitzschia inconspicua]